MNKKFAVFVDGDNICAKYYEHAIREISSTYGEILIKRVYGDWTTTYMNTWKDVLIKEPATPCQQFRSGKNATDTRIIMDAVELMIRDNNINAFCIVSSDADFYGLALRLRENGKFVLGMGKEQSNWHEACNKFVKLENLVIEEIGNLIGTPNHYGLIKNKRGVYHFLPADVDGDINDMKEGLQVRFKIIKEPDLSQPDRKNQRGRATKISLVA